MKAVKLFMVLIFAPLLMLAQAKPKATVLKKINAQYCIYLAKFNKKYNLYTQPKIVFKKKHHSIKGFDKNNFCGTDIKISPNKKFIVLEHISKGLVYDGKKNNLVETYHCVVINVAQYKVVKHLQSECGGEWNEQNEWVNNGETIFSTVAVN
jgi:hypothetical protein